MQLTIALSALSFVLACGRVEYEPLDKRFSHLDNLDDIDGDGHDDINASDPKNPFNYCKNGEKDFDEVDIDCGGPVCAACNGGSMCLTVDDCLSELCTDKVCANIEMVGTLVGTCGDYDVYNLNGEFVASNWMGKVFVGDDNANEINGTSGPDLVLGLAGNDRLFGGAGHDVLCGGDDVDVVYGEVGNDYLDGGPSNDIISGGNGDYDSLFGRDGNDTLLDSDGAEVVDGGAGNDYLSVSIRIGWSDREGQPSFRGLRAGYDNDRVILSSLSSSPFFIDISGDEYDDPASPLEGTDDTFRFSGKMQPDCQFLKFESTVIVE